MKVKKEFKNDPLVTLAKSLMMLSEDEIDEKSLEIINYYKNELCNK
tara:strand:+ start:859 stop:996 length:138 start_codon:yes stop_codon:yes gene_type:complete